MDKISPEFAAALIKATSQIEGAVKDTENPYFKSMYADLAGVIGAIKKPLTDNGIAFFQRIIPGDRVQIETLAIYLTGETLSLGTISLPIEKNTAQAVGSAISYGRRYGLACAFSVPQLDDDGTEASAPASLPTSTKKLPPPIDHTPGEPHVYYIPDISREQTVFMQKRGGQANENGFWYLQSDLGEKLQKYKITSEEQAREISIMIKLEKNQQAKLDRKMREVAA